MSVDAKPSSPHIEKSNWLAPPPPSYCHGAIWSGCLEPPSAGAGTPHVHRNTVGPVGLCDTPEKWQIKEENKLASLKALLGWYQNSDPPSDRPTDQCKV